MNVTWPDPSHKILLAVSGGLDSMALTWLLYKQGYQIALAHCDYGLRGNESTGDREFLEGFAEQLGLPLYVRRSLPEQTKNVPGKSLQMAARELRYAFFEELADEYGFDRIATAHHADDQVETILMNWLRGCGVRGMRGMLPERDRYVRPLLGVARLEIKAYAKTHHIAYRHDGSNDSTDYRRNLLRHRVVPILRQLNPSLERTVLENADRMRALETALGNQVSQAELLRKIPAGYSIDRKRLLALPSPETILFEVLHPYGFNGEQVEAILGSLQEGNTGREFLANEWQLVTQSEDLILSKKENFKVGKEIIIENDGFIRGDGWILLHRVIPRPDSLRTEGTTIYAPLELTTKPLQVRTWAAGDYMLPFGMEGHRKKLQDIFKDQKIGRHDRQQVWMLCDGQEVLWVPGVKLSEQLRIGEVAEQVLRLVFEGNEIFL